VSKVLDYDSVDKGTPLDGLSIPALTRVTLARFAGAIDDYNPMHLDDKVAAAAGKSSVFAPGHLIMAYVGRMVESCFHGAALRRYGLRMLKLVWPGDVLTCRGVIIDKRKEGGEHVIDADVWADNQRGETVAKGRVLAVVAKTRKKPLGKRAAGVVYLGGKSSSRSGGKVSKRAAATKKVVKKKRR
jgi:acyl dehydratase